jgi:hypothetical protein
MNEVQSARRQPLLTTVCVLLSAHFAIAYNTLTSAMVPFHVYKDMNGSGGPFAYRMLPALLWKVTAFLLSPLHQRFPRLHMPYLNRPFTSQEDWFVVLLTFAAMLGTLHVARRLLRTINSSWGFEWMALGMGYAAYFDTMLVLNRNLYYPYDVAALFFFTLLVYLAYQNRPIAFALVLIPAFMNKETAAMAIFIFLGLQYGRYSLRRLLSLCAGMGGLVIMIRLAQGGYIHHLCSSCGAMAQNQLSENLRQLPNPLFWLSESAVFGFAYVAVILFWRFIPMRVRITSTAVFALWSVAMLKAGILREVRIFSELSAVVLLAIGLGVHGWLQECRFEASGHQVNSLSEAEMAHL